MIYHHKKNSLICFDLTDLREIFEKESRSNLLNILSSLSYEELQNKEKLIEIANSQKLIRDKEDKEIFTAAYQLQNFYGNSKVCFKVGDSFNSQRNIINSLEDLKYYIKEGDLTDFGLLNNKNELRLFQLKSYMGKCNTEEFLENLTKILKHYSYNIGTTNILVVLQSKGNISHNFFQEVYNGLKAVNIKGSGEILITYNENNEFDVINTVFPHLTTTRVPFIKLSERIINEKY